MNRQDLLETARALPAFSAAAAQEYADQRELLVASLNQIMLQRADLDQLVGAGNHAMMQDNHHNHAEFMGALLRRCDPRVLTDSVLWVFRTYRAHGFRPDYWPVELAAWVSAGETLLAPSTRAALDPIYTWLTGHCPDFTALTEAPAAPVTCAP